MKFAAPFWLFGVTIALAVAVLLVLGGFLLLRAVRRFGDEELVTGLLTGRPGGRRALKGGLLVVAVALAFVALAKPQYGRGTRIIPATNLDVVVVLDYSKSMYARDITPSRTLRAKSEVTQLIADLPSARFGAVAFAGQPIAFPLTSDGAAIAQFFRQLAPNDMPEGGTAIGRALEAARELFARDPLAGKHKKVCLLVTDGEDLEGDPVAAAESLAKDGISVHVVQVGGRTPEPIPDVNDVGQVTGWRRDSAGQPLTTELSAEGEAQLAKIAEVGGGNIVRSGDGKTGIDVIASKLRQLMTEELSERVETVYADVYFYPLALALLLVVIETFVSETRPRAKPAVLPPPAGRRRKRRGKNAAAVAAGTLIALLFCVGCAKDRRDLFTRNAPAVDEAISALDAGDASAAIDLLTGYLSTGKCENGAIGTPARVQDLPNASFDLGLALFKLGERYGQRFGEEPLGPDAGSPEAAEQGAKRDSEVDCALRVVRAVAGQAALAPDLRARAWYLAGNLEFLRSDYKSAVDNYDSALRIVPGAPVDASDTIGRDAAHNRAIALRRIEEQDRQRDAGNDSGPPDGSPDSGDNDGGPPDSGKPDGGNDDAGQPDQQPDGGDAGAQDRDKDAGPQDAPDAGDDGGAPQPKQDEPQQQPEPPREQKAQKNERLLDELEQAPTFQEHDAKNRALMHRRLRMEDK
jgi:Ca-activated chloride channel family protein